MQEQKQKVTWGEALKVYSRPKVLAMFFLGFSAGLPFLLVFSTLAAWLTDYGVSRTTIGFFALVGLTYSIKFAWAPVIDHLRIPFFTGKLGKRRSWLLLSQLGIALCLLSLANLNPQLALTKIALISVAVAFCAASQDVVVDAFRIESASEELQGAMAANYVFGYRVALLVAGGGALYIADIADWSTSYLSMAALMGVGIITTLLVAEPDHAKAAELAKPFERAWIERIWGSGEHSGLKEWFVKAVVCPVIDFFKRNGRFALILLLLIGIYRISDLAMGVMANPFYLDLGFSKTDIFQIVKVFGFFFSILGAYLGGLLVVHYGILRPLILGAVMVAATNLLFAYMAQIGPEKNWLAIVISADNISAGISNTVFIAYLSSLVNQEYTATQYALFSSLMTLPGKFISAFSGIVVDTQGYSMFFTYAAVLGIPAILLAVYVWWRDRRTTAEGEPTTS
ncbi:AmpG family muropeptide MFS transporter [Microbulbifer hydrolyticus]|uniref:MFS transporter n=1 Tax=Microbulbifer hydrolyticus TaxID=48074 RepID=A0A6P1TAE8_9GAMM|nr:MFS transporter [Microbulbifer hydrolyticus]MBB5213263.1 PAT family beta-lactamase induction signal transducer AmpG [Microbulbifer hydrolyticus]QHQ38570.1 MFS transporter [Microbulbifer hydrolyticus]